MPILDTFFSPQRTSLKVCGITNRSDAFRLVDYRVEAVGINFWPESKRYCDPALALEFAPQIKGQILRVGVFVNANLSDVHSCFRENLIDIAQFHGDEDLDYLNKFASHKLPFIKAIGVKKPSDLKDLDQYPTDHLLLDAHAPGVYGGTGKTIDWNHAATTVRDHPRKSILLAGGITADNAHEAVQRVRPAAIDVASGAESRIGVKDFDKIHSLQTALQG